MALQPAGAMLVGAVAGLLSTLGYVFVTPALERGIGLKDTCGVHNLHGMPGVLGGVAAAVATVVVAQENRSLLTQARPWIVLLDMNYLLYHAGDLRPQLCH